MVLSLVICGGVRVEAATPESDFIFDTYSGAGRISGYHGKETEVVIPETINGITVDEIGAYAFQNKGLTSVELPEGIQKIGQGSFQNNKISVIEFPDTVTRIEDYALTTIKLNR